MSRLVVIALVVLPLAACEKKDEPKPPSTTPAATATPAATTPAATEPASASAEDGSEIPTEQDFEEEAEQKVTAENLESELDKLEKEIGEGS